MNYKLNKISIDQKAVFMDDVGNEIPVYDEDFQAKYIMYHSLYNPGSWIECLNETTFDLNKIRLYKKIYGIIPQRETEEIRKGFFIDDLEAYRGRISIELYS